MRKRIASVSVLLLVLGGCPEANPAEPSPGSLASAGASTWQDPGTESKPAPVPVGASADRTVAVINGSAITLGQLEKPLLEAYGVQFLLHLVRNDYYRQKAREANVTVTDADVAAARERMLDQLFKDSMPLSGFPGTPEQQKAAREKEMERLLPQVLSAQRVSRPEFELAMQGNAILWKIAEEDVKATVDETALQKVFRIKYGEKIKVRDIQVPNLRAATEVQRRLASGEAFDKVAREMSTDRKSAEYGGELRPFTRAEPSLSQAFKDVAFALKDGEVSSPINAGDNYHIIKLEQRIPPQVVKYEDVKDSIRQDLIAVMTNLTMQDLRKSYDSEARKLLRIEDPGLRQRYREMVEQASGEKVNNLNTLRQRIQEDERAPTDLSTQPGSGVARPPATGPGK